MEEHVLESCWPQDEGHGLRPEANLWLQTEMPRPQLKLVPENGVCGSKF